MYMYMLGRGGVPSGRIQEQDFSHFVISFLRKHMWYIVVLNSYHNFLHLKAKGCSQLMHTHMPACLPPIVNVKMLERAPKKMYKSSLFMGWHTV